jgi:RNA polymerase sigma-70 factor (ECF subfamily)
VRISRYLLRLVHDEELALDLTQDTFVRAYRSLATLRSAENVGAWLYRIATNVAIQNRSRVARMQYQPWPEQDGGELGLTESPDRQVIDRDTVAAVLHRLPHDRLVCLLLHVNEGFNYEEVAVIVNSTPEAVRKRIARAKQQFRELYDEACEESIDYAVR